MLEIRIVICLITLTIASIMDLRKREISDKIWLGSGIISIIIFIIDYNNINILSYLITAGIISILSYIIYRAGLFGGADAKALIIISLLIPNYDINNSIHNIVPLVVLTNSLLLTLFNITHNIIRNSISILKGNDIFHDFNTSFLRKLLAFMIGFRVNKINGYLFLMEERCANGKKRFRFNINAYDEFAQDTKDVWVTPALPFIIYITIGFVITVVYGDILGMFINYLI